MSGVVVNRACQYTGRSAVLRGQRAEGLDSVHRPRGLASVLYEQECQADGRSYEQNVQVSVEKQFQAGSVLSRPGLHVGVGQVLGAKGPEQRSNHDELGEYDRVQKPVEPLIRVSQTRRFPGQRFVR